MQVIAPEEIIDPSVDEQSVMTYLSQFPKAKLKPGAPLKPKLNPKKARAYGPGIRKHRGEKYQHEDCGKSQQELHGFLSGYFGWLV